MNLSKKEAVQFVTEILGISVPSINLEEDCVTFLNMLIKATHSSVPFQNITLLGQTEADRHKPILKEIKAAMMGGFGGLCYSIGVFMTSLLQALGYEAYLSAGSIKNHPGNHIIVIVENLTTPGSKHLVDAWCGWPTFEAIPLDFDVESTIYSHSFLEFKFARKCDTITRLHRGGHFTQAILPGDSSVQWRKIYEVDLTPRELSHFDQEMSDIYTLPSSAVSPFLLSFRAIIFNNLKLVAIKDTTLILEKDNHQIVSTKFSSREEMISTMKTYFPQFNVEDITKALNTLHLLE